MIKRRRRSGLFLIIFAVAFVAIIIFLQSNVASMVNDVGKASVDAMTKTAVNEAVFITLDEIDYDSVINISRDSDGNVISITSNSSRINKIARTTAKLSQDKLTSLTKDGISVPFGVFTGIRWLAGYGMAVKVKVVPVSSVQCDFYSTFQSAGINQTKHSIYLKVKAKVTLVIPTGTVEVITETQVFVCESIINGKIPNVYFNGGVPIK